MFNIFRFIIIILFSIVTISLSANYGDVKILKSSAQETIYEYSVQKFELDKATIEDGISYQIPNFKNAVFAESNRKTLL